MNLVGGHWVSWSESHNLWIGLFSQILMDCNEFDAHDQHQECFQWTCALRDFCFGAGHSLQSYMPFDPCVCYQDTRQQCFGFCFDRAAAARCREKRKRWVQTLQQKADDLSGVNYKLCVRLLDRWYFKNQFVIDFL